MQRISYRTLLSHRWKHLWRSDSGNRRLLKALLAGGLVAYMAFALAVVGYALPDLLIFYGYPPTAVPLLNEYLIVLGVLLLPSRFLLQRSIKLDFRPYLSLPIPHGQLVRFAQLAGLASLFNVIPFAFILPFWGRTIVPDVSMTVASLWLLGCILLVLVTHFITEGLRLMHLRYRRAFRTVASAAVILVGIDIGLQGNVLTTSSLAIFSGLLNGNPLWLLPLLIAVALCSHGAAILLKKHLQHGAIPKQRRPYSFTPAFFDREAGPIGRLLLLDWTLLLRNRRPRRSLTIAFIISVLNVPFLLTPDVGMDMLSGALAAGVSLILLPSSYGQYLFSWDSQHFDGFLSWPIDARHLIQARMIMLMLLSFGVFVCVLPFFYVLAPHHLLLLSCFFLYVLGIASPALIFVGLWNRKPLRLSKGAVLNYEGLSMKQFLVNLPIFVPLLGILLLMPLETALWTLALVGGTGLLAFPVWTHYFTHLFTRRRHIMASGFRTLDV